MGKKPYQEIEMNTQSPPPNLSEERLRELERLYSKAAQEEWIAFWSDQFGWCLNSLKSGYLGEKEYRLAADLHNAFPSLLHAAEQMAQASQEIYILQMLLKDAKCPECDGSGAVVTLDRREQPYQMQCQWCHYKAEALKSLPPAPEKGGAA